MQCKYLYNFLHISISFLNLKNEVNDRDMKRRYILKISLPKSQSLVKLGVRFRLNIANWSYNDSINIVLKGN